jgi:DNA (cytosine-5)-methyltransferase 1
VNRLVLSVFPGLGLLDRAFEEAGFTVVRGPDILWGGDMRHFHVPPGVFAGIIGGPPCQPHSTAAEIRGTEAIDLIPEFVRVVGEGQPDWAVMENVRGAVGHAGVPPEWHHTILSDCDCGGETKRTRAFWTWPFFMMAPGGKWGGESSHSVMATTWKRGKSDSPYVADKGFLPGDLSVEEYERLQGVPGLTAALRKAGANKSIAVHMLGNGVPMSLGRYVAKSVVAAMYAGEGATK